MSQRFPKSAHLRRKAEFEAVSRAGKKVSAGHLVVLVKANPLGRRRLGLTVSRKVGNAVRRNKVKRWIRELFRKRGELLPPGVDLVVIARPGAFEVGFERISEDFAKAGQVLCERMKPRTSPSGDRP